MHDDAADRDAWRLIDQHAVGGGRRDAMTGGEHEIARQRRSGAEIAARRDDHHDMAAGAGVAHLGRAAHECCGGGTEGKQ